ncbi:MAG: SPOR domain-containing protein [Desulfobacteraceae bacterium]
MSIIWIFLLLSVSLLYAPFIHGEEPFFSIALSKFNDEQDAKKEETKLKNSGHNAFYREEKSQNNRKTIYQIYIEKYNSRDEAEKEAKVLKELELISDYTVREVKKTLPVIPEQEVPEEKKEPEVSPVPQPSESREKAIEPGPGAEEVQTTAPEPNHAGTEEQTKAAEPSPAIKKTKPASVINHNNSRLTGASLQVGAFSDEAIAAKLQKKLKGLGKKAFYRLESAGSKGDFYRLYITGYSTLHEAIEDAKALVKSGVISGYSRVHSKGPISGTSSKEKKGKTYFLHISSNKDKANAAEYVAKLKEYGYKAFYVLEKDRSVSWYRVYIGEFKNEAEARKKGTELLDKGIISYFKPLVIDRKKLNN